MITFRKHAAGTTQRFDSRLIRRPLGARAVPRIVASLAIIFALAAAAAAAPRQDGRAAPTPAADSPSKPAAGGAPASKVPVKVYVAGTPEDPYIVARIGDFPTELGEPGDEFLKREFIEQFMRDVLGLSGRGEAAALKIALLPQADGKEQECSFTFGEVAGRITVRLAERSVFVLVSFADKEDSAPTLVAALKFASGEGVKGRNG